MSYYKIVSIPTGESRSFYSVSLGVTQVFSDDRNIVQYKPKEWVFPKNTKSKLFVFRKKSLAVDFLRSMGRFVVPVAIWECRVKKPIKFEAICKQPAWDNYFWERCIESKFSIRKMKQHDFVGQAPEGTYICDAVMLTREV